MVLQAPCAESRELWKGFILSVGQVCALFHLLYLTEFLKKLILWILIWHISEAKFRFVVYGKLFPPLQLSVPLFLNLLPGQIHVMGDAVQKEKERLANIRPPADTDCTPPNSTQSDMPSWVSDCQIKLLLSDNWCIYKDI